MTQGSTVRGRAAGRLRAAVPTAPPPIPFKGRRRMWSGLLVTLLLAATLAVAACGSASGGDSDSTVNVLAASSLTEAFTKLGGQYEAAHPGVKVVFDFAGGPELVTQLKQGAPADVFAVVDSATMDSVADLVGGRQAFAGNTLAIVVAPGNPRQVHSLADLSSPDLKVVLVAPEVPSGKYTQQVLDKAGVAVKPVSLEQNVKGVVTKVSLDEADAGIVYVTDVTAAKDRVEGVPIPAGQNLMAAYWIAPVGSSKQRAQAQDFVTLVLSAEGQKTLQGFGFLPAGAK